MVAKITCGKSIRGVLSYNEQKVRSREAVLLGGEGFAGDVSRMTFRSKLTRFEKLTVQNERTKTNTVHISLNFSNRDTVTDDMLEYIARDYMERIGFGGQPYLVYRHYDAAHPHIHIATVNIADGGQRIETHNIGKERSEPARRALEEAYGLVRAEDQSGEDKRLPAAVALERVVYGKKETKRAITEVLLEVLATYKFSSLPELNAVLRQFGILADRGMPGSAMHERRGLIYTLLDGDGRRVGVPIKASAIYTSPTLTNLEKRFASGAAGRKPYSQRLRHQAEKALTKAGNRQELEALLHDQGIRILLRSNGAGQIYGATFIDNATRCVFNGSDLGKAFSAKALEERLVQLDAKTNNIVAGESGTLPVEKVLEAGEAQASAKIPATELPAISVLLDIAMTDRHEENLPDPVRKKRRRLGIE